MGSGRSLERSFDFAQDDMVRCVSVVATRTCPNSALESSVVVLTTGRAKTVPIREGRTAGRPPPTTTDWGHPHRTRKSQQAQTVFRPE